MRARLVYAGAGFPFGIGLGQTADSVDSMGALFSSYGADLIDAKGNITVKSDAVKQVLECTKKLIPFLPLTPVCNPAVRPSCSCGALPIRGRAP